MAGAHAQVGTEPPASAGRNAIRPQNAAIRAAASPAVNVTGIWYGNLSAPGDSSAAQWAQEFVLNQDATGAITGSRKTVALGASKQFVWSQTGTVSGTQLTLNDTTLISQMGSTDPCKSTLTLTVSADGSSFSGTWAAPTQSGCNGGTISATRYGGASAKRLGSGAPCDGGEGSALLAGGGSGGTASGNANGSSCAEKMGAPRVGDPIDASTGNFYLQEDDFVGGEWLSFSRFYNSADGVAPASLGFNWRHSYDRSLQFFGSPVSSIVMLRPDGKQETFTKTANGWSTDLPVDVLSEITNAQGAVTGYQVFIGGRRHTETYALDGKLLSIMGQDGQGVTLTYTAPNPIALLNAVTDSAGRTLLFYYDNYTYRLSLVKFPDNSYASFSYVAKNGTLSGVVYANGAIHNYGYGETGYVGATALPRALTGLTDGTTNRYESITYDDLGRATSSSFVGGVGATKIAYNADGSSDITYPLGNTVHMGFSSPAGLGRVSTLSAACAPDCGQPWRSRTYDALGFPETAVDFKGTIQRTRYNAYGLLEQTIEAQGTASQRTTTTTWDTSLRQPLKQTLLGATGNPIKTSTWAYNAMGQVVARCEADPAIAGANAYACTASGTAPAGVRRWTYTYCTAVDTTQCPRVGLLLSQTGPRRDLNETTTYRYYLSAGTAWKAGDLQTITDALGHVTTFSSYDLAGRVSRMVDANGVITDFAYDSVGHPVARTVRANADGSASSTLDATTTVVFDQRGLIYQSTDPDGTLLKYTYDTAHRLTEVTDANGNRIHYTLDVAGNRTREETFDAGGVSRRLLSRTFNTLGQLVSVTDGLGHVVFDATATGSYDANGNLVAVKDALGVTGQDTYDALDRRVTHITNVNGTDATKATTTALALDALDRITSVSDPEGLVTTYTFDGLGNLSGQVSPDTGTQSSTFDAAGNTVTHTDAKGTVVTQTFDALGRKTADTYADATLNAAYRYDETNSVTGCASSFPIGRLTRMVETAVTTTYCYDNEGRVTEKRQTQGGTTDTTDYAYTRAGRLAGTAMPSGAVVAYTRNTLGQITSISATPAGGKATSIVSAVSYRPFGPVTGYTLGSGQVVTRTYDANGAVTDVNSAHFNAHYQRDAAGQIVGFGSSPTSGNVETYAYDPLHRLTAVQSASFNESYTYSKTGDRLSKASSDPVAGAQGPYTYQPGTHRLVDVNGGPWTFDANGSVTQRQVPGATISYVYDGRGRLAEQDNSGYAQATFAYNAMSQRVSLYRSSSGQVSRFVYDEAGQLLGNYGFLPREYIWMDGLPVGALSVQQGAAYVIADGMGTPRRVDLGDGSSRYWQWLPTGNPFGERSFTGNYVFNLRFPGQYFDTETGLLYNVHRYYHPDTGRYLQSDPIGLAGGVGTYGYVGANPLNSVDSSGTQITVRVVETVAEEDKAEYERDPITEILNPRLGVNQAEPLPEISLQERERIEGECPSNPQSWSAGRRSYWKQAARDRPYDYSAEDLRRMSSGQPPMHPEVEVPMELHHIKAQRDGGGHEPENLMEVWPWEHAEIDPFRYYNGPFPNGYTPPAKTGQK
ncbi:MULTISPECIES: RHS repeat-associated core domain-containing protein [unclassified Luteibacter]|uniref:RHS repeat-associated core domain-containing protein n=1 Tax=Luteibacter sp. PvP019 TaxID=3156436 RepID=UPI00339847D4